MVQPSRTRTLCNCHNCIKYFPVVRISAITEAEREGLNFETTSNPSALHSWSGDEADWRRHRDSLAAQSTRGGLVSALGISAAASAIFPDFAGKSELGCSQKKLYCVSIHELDSCDIENDHEPIVLVQQSFSACRSSFCIWPLRKITRATITTPNIRMFIIPLLDSIFSFARRNSP